MGTAVAMLRSLHHELMRSPRHPRNQAPREGEICCSSCGELRSGKGAVPNEPQVRRPHTVKDGVAAVGAVRGSLRALHGLAEGAAHSEWLPVLALDYFFPGCSPDVASERSACFSD